MLPLANHCEDPAPSSVPGPGATTFRMRPTQANREEPVPVRARRRGRGPS
jgi:hypothetical protein